MAAEGAGALRWGAEERRLVYGYLEDGEIDPNRVESATYLRGIKVKEAVWDRHPNKNFYQNVRRMVAQWQADQGRAGGRRGGEDDEADEAEEEGAGSPAPAPAPGQGGQGNPPARQAPGQPRAQPQGSQRNRDDQALSALLSGLRLGVEPQAEEDEDDMLMYHFYDWYEAILPEEERAHGNIRLRRLTIDVLLPGPTTLSQIRAIMSSDGNTLHFTYRPPLTYLDHDRTAVRLAVGSFGQRAGAAGPVRDTIQAASRNQAHRTALETVKPQQQEKVRSIKLPFQCDRHFCRRDDWGRDNQHTGMEIGTYQHENPEMQRNNQLRVDFAHRVVRR